MDERRQDHALFQTNNPEKVVMPILRPENTGIGSWNTSLKICAK